MRTKKEATTLEELITEKNSIEDSIRKTTDEINAKRRAVSEMKTKVTELDSRINAKRYELLANSISDKTGMNMDKFMTELDKGNVLVDSEK